jgi:hypothetical protein
MDADAAAGIFDDGILAGQYLIPADQLEQVFAALFPVGKCFRRHIDNPFLQGRGIVNTATKKP